MKPKTDQELRDMGWLGLDRYHDALLTMIDFELDPNVDLTPLREEVKRVERMMELVS